jgi:ribonuclease HII
MIMTTSNPIIRKNQYERAAWDAQSTVCGVDEVGRGCLAGPVVTAAVILHPNKCPRQLKDSKVLDHAELVKAYDWIVQNSWFGFGIVSHTDIDAHNIYQATLIAMKRAVMQALTSAPALPSAILVDAMPLKLTSTGYKDIAVHHFTKAESKSSSVAAASIIAKVKRDALMRRLDGVVTGYEFTAHKGYATDIHCQALRNQGKSIIHRESFLSFLQEEQETPGTLF